MGGYDTTNTRKGALALHEDLIKGHMSPGIESCTEHLPSTSAPSPSLQPSLIIYLSFAAIISASPLAVTMSHNRILAKKVLCTVLTRNGKNLVLSAATETSAWIRPDSAAEAMRAPLEAAVAANESVIPRNTAELILR